MPWEVSIPEAERDPALPRKLEEELPGILAWLVQGALAWQVRGLDPPAEVAAETEEYREEHDVLAGFISDKCVEGPECTAKSDALYVAYKEWCDLNGERQEAQNKFAIRLKERGYEKSRNKHGRIWKGIGLRGTDPTPGDGPDTDPTPPETRIDSGNSSTDSVRGVGYDRDFGLSGEALTRDSDVIPKNPTPPDTPTPGVIGDEESTHEWLRAWESE